MPNERWGELAWPQIEARTARDAPARTVAVLPLGAVEAHGPHLPLLTDGVIAEAMAEAAAERLAGSWSVLRLPTQHYSAAPFAEAFPGTISMRPETVSALLVDIGRGLDGQVDVLAIANAHLDPAHLGSIDRALAELAQTTDLALAFPNLTRKPWALRLGDEFKSGACHAGQFEGSIVLAARPQWVRRDVAAELAPNPSSISRAIRAGKRTFAEAGGPEAYFGDPAAATAAEGEATIATLGEILAEAIEEAVAS